MCEIFLFFVSKICFTSLVNNEVIINAPWSVQNLLILGEEYIALINKKQPFSFERLQ